MALCHIGKGRRAVKTRTLTGTLIPSHVHDSDGLCMSEVHIMKICRTLSRKLYSCCTVQYRTLLEVDLMMMVIRSSNRS